MSTKARIRDSDALQRIIDRQEILDCLLRFTRGADRGDADLLLSAYHEDAHDDHGYFIGSPADFLKWASAYRASVEILTTHHAMSNQVIDFTGPDEAHVESYYVCERVFGGEKTHMTLTGGRYVDRLERRDGEWRIANRVCLTEWKTVLDVADPNPGQVFMPSLFNKEDVSYDRPLKATRAATTGTQLPKPR